MNYFFLLFSLLILSSCSSNKVAKVPLQEQINELEAKTVQEMRNHAAYLLDSHPEVSEDLKQKIKSMLDATMKRHQDLKDEESKVIQLMLQKSVTQLNRVNEEDDSKKLKSLLLEIYRNKSSNIFNLIMQVNQMAQKSEIGNDLKRDMFLYIREFR